MDFSLKTCKCDAKYITNPCEVKFEFSGTNCTSFSRKNFLFSKKWNWNVIQKQGETRVFIYAGKFKKSIWLHMDKNGINFILKMLFNHPQIKISYTNIFLAFYHQQRDFLFYLKLAILMFNASRTWKAFEESKKKVLCWLLNEFN